MLILQKYCYLCLSTHISLVNFAAIGKAAAFIFFLLFVLYCALLFISLQMKKETQYEVSYWHTEFW